MRSDICISRLTSGGKKAAPSPVGGRVGRVKIGGGGGRETVSEREVSGQMVLATSVVVLTSIIKHCVGEMMCQQVEKSWTRGQQSFHNSLFLFLCQTVRIPFSQSDHSHHRLDVPEVRLRLSYGQFISSLTLL